MAATANAPERVLMIERVFDAPRELVFKCWTDPVHLARWIGPRGFTATILSCEPCQGGDYRIHMRSSEGQEIWQRGVFQEVVAPERIVRTYFWTDADGNPTRPETLLTVTFEDLGSRTKLTLHQAIFESVAARDAHRGGWSSSLDQLSEYVKLL
jgi:uncharacterized protein YndB with AHSA1/START domain